MIKALSYLVTCGTIAATILIVSGTAAAGQQAEGGLPSGSIDPQGTMAQHHHHPMEGSAMMQEPHHVLAMAYRNNLVTFAKALRHHAAEATTVNLDFARATVAEMTRSFDQMQQHSQEHLQTMDATMKTRMADMVKRKDERHAAIQEHLAALDQEVHTGAPDAGSVSTHLDAILMQCDGMSRMHTEAMEHRMTGPKDRTKH